MDNFAEQLVYRQPTASDKTRSNVLLIVGILLTATLAALAVLQLGSPMRAFLGLILSAACGYGTYFMRRNAYVEYEYTFTNGELDIDKITAKTKRSEMITVDVKNFTAFGKYSDLADKDTDRTTVIATDNTSENDYYADLEHEAHGETRIIFDPDERMLENITKFLPAKLRLQNND